MQLNFFVYILFSPSLNKYYIGYTADSLDERLRKHNSPHKGFTSAANDWTIVYTESFSSKSEAIKREKFIKKLKSRKFIQKLISNSNTQGSAHPDLQRREGNGSNPVAPTI
ncbi:MAG: GIY-YIG nuclease family protein [candidate division WOR-3 bacterium]